MPTAPRPARSTADRGSPAPRLTRSTSRSSPDGIHQLAVRATDAQGNVGPSAVSAFTLDRTVRREAPSITSAPSSPGSSATVSWSFTTPDGTTTRCRIDTEPAFNCAGSVTRTFTADGLHRFTVVAVDPAGNRSATARWRCTRSIASPRCRRRSPARPRAPDRVTTPQWTFVIEADSAGECSIDGSSWAPCTTTFSADLSAAADGLHTFAVRSVDAAGNVGAPATSGLRARSHPAEHAGHHRRARRVQRRRHPDVDASPSTPTRPPGAASTTAPGPRAPARSPPTLAAESDGIHSLEVKAVDAVGNEGPTVVVHVRARSPGARRRRPHRGAAEPRQRPHPRVGVHLRAGHGRMVLDRRGHTRSSATGPLAARAPDRRRLRGRRGRRRRGGEHERPDHQRLRAGHASHPRPRSSRRRAPPTGTCTPSGASRWSPARWPSAPSTAVSWWRAARSSPPTSSASRAPTTCRSSPATRPGTSPTRSPAPTSSTPSHRRRRCSCTPPTGRRGTGGSASRRAPPPSAPSTADHGRPAPARSPAGCPDATVRFEVRAVDRAGNRSAITRTTVTPTLATAVEPASPARPSARPQPDDPESTPARRSSSPT